MLQNFSNFSQWCKYVVRCKDLMHTYTQTHTLWVVHQEQTMAVSFATLYDVWKSTKTKQDNTSICPNGNLSQLETVYRLILYRDNAHNISPILVIYLFSSLQGKLLDSGGYPSPTHNSYFITADQSKTTHVYVWLAWPNDKTAGILIPVSIFVKFSLSFCACGSWLYVSGVVLRPALLPEFPIQLGCLQTHLQSSSTLRPVLPTAAGIQPSRNRCFTSCHYK